MSYKESVVGFCSVLADKRWMHCQASSLDDMVRFLLSLWLVSGDRSIFFTSAVIKKSTEFFYPKHLSTQLTLSCSAMPCILLTSLLAVVVLLFMHVLKSIR